MTNWEKCRDFGVIEIRQSKMVLLYYNEFSYQIAGGPLSLNVESAMWQGSNLILRGHDDYGREKVYAMNEFNSYRPIM